MALLFGERLVNVLAQGHAANLVSVSHATAHLFHVAFVEGIKFAGIRTLICARILAMVRISGHETAFKLCLLGLA